MDAVKQVFEIDYTILIPALIISGTTILLAVKFITELLDWILIDKLGIETKWTRKKRQEHELLISTANGLKELSNRHNEAVKQSISHDKEIREELKQYVSEIKQSVEENKNTIQVYSENRVSDREKSREIQKEINESIDELSQGANERKQQIEALMCGIMELLGDKIDQRFSKYIAMKGIPENEVDEFNGLWDAYHNYLHGNHGREQKYLYAINHLPVIPVEVNLIYDEKEED